MARVFLLIDGYNLLHAAGLGRRRFAKGGLELARRKLLLKLAAEMASDVCRDTVVVFDAGADAESRQNSETAAPAGEVDWPFAVVYATQTQSADDAISLRKQSRQQLLLMRHLTQQSPLLHNLFSQISMLRRINILHSCRQHCYRSSTRTQRRTLSRPVDSAR